MLKKRNKQIFILILLVLFLIILNYKSLDNFAIKFLGNKIEAKVLDVIDGDTIKVQTQEENFTVRLLGINTPEKKEFYYSETKNFLRDILSNKTVFLKYGKEKKDLYGRTLAYVFLNNENVNLKMVKRGFANFYFPSGKDNFYEEFKNAWLKCIEDKINLCEKSDDVCGSCVYIENFYVKNQMIELKNKCLFQCDVNGWSIKDEGRKKFVFENVKIDSNEKILVIVGNGTNKKNAVYWTNEEYVLTKTGDSIFLRDENGKLVDWKNFLILAQ